VGHPASPIIYITGSGRGPRPPKGQSVKSGRGARSARPQRPSRRTGGDTDDHPIAPTKPLSAGPHAGVPAGPPGRAEAGCGIRPSGGGSGPRGQRRRTADPTRRLPPGIWYQVWPAAIRPQTPAVPGTKRPPGFGRRGGTPRSPRCGPRPSHPPQASRPRPKGHSELRMASEGREDTGQTQSAAAADVLLRGRLPGPEGVELTHPGKRDDRAGKSSGEIVLASTQTLRRPSGA
jgi:hypothetical protein